jgi:hypothetical protein
MANVSQRSSYCALSLFVLGSHYTFIPILACYRTKFSPFAANSFPFSSPPPLKTAIRLLAQSVFILPLLWTFGYCRWLLWFSVGVPARNIAPVREHESWVIIFRSRQLVPINRTVKPVRYTWQMPVLFYSFLNLSSCHLKIKLFFLSSFIYVSSPAWKGRVIVWGVYLNKTEELVSFRSLYLFYLLVHSRCRGCLFSLDHTQTHNTVDRAPLDAGSARRRDLYLTTQTLYKRQTSIPPVGFEHTIPASALPQTYALERAAAGIGKQGTHDPFFSLETHFCIKIQFQLHRRL